MTPDTQLRLDEAAAHLCAAADAARSDGTIRGQHLAGLVLVTVAGVNPYAPSSADTLAAEGSVEDRLRSALAVLDGIDPLDGPPDLLAWSWTIADLLRHLSTDQAGQP